MVNPQISRLRTLGLLFCLGGACVITLGWMGTAQYAHVDQQLPYLLSGGAAGLGMVLFGVGLLVIAQIRAESDKIAERIAAANRPADASPGVPSQRSAKDQGRSEGAERDGSGSGTSSGRVSITDTAPLPLHKDPADPPGDGGATGTSEGRSASSVS